MLFVKVLASTALLSIALNKYLMSNIKYHQYFGPCHTRKILITILSMGRFKKTLSRCPRLKDVDLNVHTTRIYKLPFYERKILTYTIVCLAYKSIDPLVHLELEKLYCPKTQIQVKKDL